MKHSSSRFGSTTLTRPGDKEINANRRKIVTSVGVGVGVLTIPAILRSAPTTVVSEQASPSAGQITVLYDAFGKTSLLKKDWGFAAFIEYGGKRILFDTGNNAEIFAQNAKAKAIDLTKLDFAVVSHRHGDHTSGLNYLLSVNPSVPIYAPKENFGVFGAALPGTFYRRDESLPPEMRYYDGSPPPTMRFGTPWPQANFKWVDKGAEVARGFHLVLLKGSWGVDLDVMEISLAIDTPDGIVLVVGCSHPTIEKVVEAGKAAINKPVHLVLGGTHLLPATDEQIRGIANALRDTWKVAWIAPVHCTGEPAFAILKQVFGDRYIYAGLGTTVALGPTVKSVAETGQPKTYAMDDEDLCTYSACVSVASACCAGKSCSHADSSGHHHSIAA
jgi:7,8-dihydropterin-6-yl-methyl-4-(beta-D-ribofuranosyl)aminobenzene 5'-phosphate synthase